MACPKKALYICSGTGTVWNNANCFLRDCVFILATSVDIDRTTPNITAQSNTLAKTDYCYWIKGKMSWGFAFFQPSTQIC